MDTLIQSFDGTYGALEHVLRNVRHEIADAIETAERAGPAYADAIITVIGAPFGAVVAAIRRDEFITIAPGFPDLPEEQREQIRTERLAPDTWRLALFLAEGIGTGLIEKTDLDTDGVISCKGGSA